MKGFIHLILSVTFSISLAAQNKKEVDSLQELLNTTDSDTVRALTLAELSFQYRFFHPDSSLLLGRQGLTLSRKIGYVKGEVKSLSSAGFVLRELGDLTEAMELQLQSLKIAEANNLHLEAGLSMIRLATIYRDLADYPTSMQYLRASFFHSEKARNERGKVIANMILGQTFLEMDQIDSAFFYESNAQRMIFRMKLTDLYPYMHRAMGEIHKKLNNPELALQYYRQAIEFSKDLKLGDNRTISIAYNNIASLFKEKNQMDSAIYYSKMALENAEAISSVRAVSEAALQLSLIYEPIDAAESYRYFKIAARAKDSILSRDKFVALQQMTFEKQEQDQLIEQEKRAYKARLKLYALICGLVIILIVAIVLYRNNRQKQQANLLLQKTLQELKSTQSQLIQAEKMASLGELTSGIAHEIQNPLNFVNNFSEVNKDLLSEMKAEMENGNLSEAKSIAEDVIVNEEKIIHHGKRADAIVKGMLQHSQAGTGKKALTDINALADEYLRLALHAIKGKGNNLSPDMTVAKIAVITDFDEQVKPISIVPQDIGRVLLNLYNNAFWAVNEVRDTIPGVLTKDYHPQVSIITRKQGDQIEITVKDNGNGIPEDIRDKIFQPFFTTKPTGQGTGLGLSLAYDIVKAHGGEIGVTSKLGEGTTFLILLPASA